jgi:bla regulator protein blaR1
MNAIDLFASALLVRLAWTSLQATLLIGALWLLGRRLQHLSPAVRCMLWWLLGAQLIVGLAVSTPVRLPLLSPAPPAIVVATTDARPHTAIAPTDEFADQGTATAAIPPTTPSPTSAPIPVSVDWPLLAAALWLAGLLLQLLLIVRQWRTAHHVLRASRLLQDRALHALCQRQAEALGLRRCPQLRVSSTIASPQVSGLWRPVVLLPADHSLTPEEVSMALAHELAHLSRGDLWLGWVPAIAQRLFFFHPLVAWAMREYALNREAACDAQVMQQHHAAPQDYGRLLLRLGVAHPMHAGLAGASPTFHNLKRRLGMLQPGPRSMPRAVGWLLVAIVALVGVLPYRVVAAHGPMQNATGTADGSATPPAPPAVPVPPPPPAVPSPAAPPPPPPPAAPAVRHTGTDIDIDTDTPTNGYAYALFDGSDGNLTIAIHGSPADRAAAERLHAGDTPMFWFRRGNQAYVIRDPAYVARARALYAPMRDYWREAGRFEGEQWSLKGPLEGLADWQRDVQAQRREVQADPQQPGAKERLASLERQQREISTRVAELNRQLTKLQPQLDALARQRQQLAVQANRQASALVDEALARGLAQQVGQR